jgi:molybdate transport system regulatory protein
MGFSISQRIISFDLPEANAETFVCPGFLIKYVFEKNSNQYTMKGIIAMASQPRKLSPKSKIWIEDENGRVVFGAGRLRILKAIEEHGSILAAAKALSMSYRAVWGKIKATEERLGQPILRRQTGGSHGGGSQLTPFAETLVDRFKQLEELNRSTADALFSGVFAGALAEKTTQSEEKKEKDE